MLPCLITGIRIIMSCDAGVFSQCPEAAALSAHKHLWERMNHRLWKCTSWTSHYCIWPYCQPLTTGHIQRNDTLKLMAAINYLTGADLYQVGSWSFNFALVHELDNLRFSASQRDGQWGAQRVMGKQKLGLFVSSCCDLRFLLYQLPNFLERAASLHSFLMFLVFQVPLSGS